MNFRKFAGLAAAAGIAATGLVSATPPAQAAAQEVCTGANYGCFWWLDDAQGTMYRIPGSIPEIPYPHNDQARSIFNPTGWYMVVYEHKNYNAGAPVNSRCLTVRPKTATTNAGYIPRLALYGMQDNITSIKFHASLTTIEAKCKPVRG